MGYAVNHTAAVSTARRGSGLAYGFCHMLALPENWRLIFSASASIDCTSSHRTYSGFDPSAAPSPASGRGGASVPRSRACGRGRRSARGRAG